MDQRRLGSVDTPIGRVDVVGLFFGQPTPFIVLISGIHGNEINGPVAFQSLVERLRSLESAGHVKRGILVIPVANPLATDTARRCFPFEEADLHSSFDLETLDTPRSVEERLIAPLKKSTESAEYVVDVHSSNSIIFEAPQVRYYRSENPERRVRLRQLACSARLPYVWEKRESGPSIEREAATPVGQSIVGWHKGFGLFVLAGVAGTVNGRAARHIAAGLIRLLRYVGAIDVEDSGDEGEESLVVSEDGPYRMTSIQLERDSPYLVWLKRHDTARGGLFVPSEEIVAGSVLPASHCSALGTLIDPRSAEKLASVVVNHELPAHLMSLRVSGLVYPGGLLARLVFPFSKPPRSSSHSHNV